MNCNHRPKIIADYVEMNESDKFLEWYWAEREKGLIDMQFFIAAASGTTCESVFREVNEALASNIVSVHKPL